MNHVVRNNPTPETQNASKLKRLVMWMLGKKEPDPKRQVDFEVHCVFDHQLRPYGYPKHGDTVEIAMQSGKIGIFKVEHLRNWPGHTGQRDWKFWFQGYKDT